MNQSCSFPIKVEPLPTSTKIRRRNHVYDFSNENYDVNGPFEKCISIFSGISACVRLVPAELKGTISIEVFSINVATIQYEVGGPVGLTFGVENVGKGAIMVSLSTDEETGKHSIVLDYLIEGPFGVDIARGITTIKLPF